MAFTAPPRPLLRRAVVTVVLLTVLIALAERGFRYAVASVFLPTGTAHWIWAPEAAEEGGPTAFYAVKDFKLARVPPHAAIQLVADEEYLLTVNGVFVGSGRGVDDMQLEVYDIGSLLRRGRNRLLVELRSSRGAGGFLARLDLPVDDPPRSVVSDGSWRIFPNFRRDLLRGPLPDDRGESAKDWGLPPAGRWRYPRGGAARPLAPAASQGPGLPARSVREQAAEHGYETTVIDFGQEVEGYLVVHTRGKLPLATVQYGLELPDPDAAPAELLVAPRGAGLWRDAEPRRFRYAVLSGLVKVEAAEIVPAAPGIPLGPLVAPEREGILGIRPPVSGTPMEDELWRRF